MTDQTAADLTPEAICRLIVEAPNPTVAAYRIWGAINGQSLPARGEGDGRVAPTPSEALDRVQKHLGLTDDEVRDDPIACEPVPSLDLVAQNRTASHTPGAVYGARPEIEVSVGGAHGKGDGQ